VVDPQERILIAHPSLPDDEPAEVSREQFEKLWAPRDWFEVEREPDEPPKPTAPPRKRTAAPKPPESKE
jgi:hypothetical protein